MEPGSQILVSSGNYLEIKDDTKIFGCDQQWQGIRVLDNASFSIDNSIIEDAQYAVFAEGGNNHLSITNNHFNRNFIGIFVNGPAGGQPPPTIFDSFYGNTFDGGDGLLPPYPAQSSAPTSTIGNKSFAGLWVQTHANTIHSLENVFKNMSNGIYSNQTNMKVSKNMFLEIRENGYPDWTSGFAIRANDYFGSTNFQMTGCGFGDGDSASVSLTSKAVRIEGMRVDYIANNIIKADQGIELLNNAGKIGVRYNTILAWAKNGIELSHTDPSATVFIDQNNIIVAGIKGVGIQSNMIGLPPGPSGGVNLLGNSITLENDKTSGIELVSNHSAKVESNIISAKQGISGFRGISITNDNGSALNCNHIETESGTLNKTIGISTWDGENTTFRCNRVTNMQRGMTFQMGSTSPENIRETTFSGNEVGLMLTASAALGPQTHKGNKWVGTFGVYGAQHASNNPTIWFLSQFTVNTSTSGTYRPTLPNGQGQWFSTDFSGTPSNTCQTSDICPNFPAALDGGLFEIDAKIADGTFQPGEYPQEMGWLARRYLYRKLVKNPSLITDGSSFEDFYNATGSQSVSSFQGVENGISDLIAIPAGTFNQLTANFDTIGFEMNALGIIDSLLWSNGSYGSIHHQRLLTLKRLNGKTQANKGMMATVLVQRETDANLVGVQNDNIPTSLTLEANEKTVHEIYLKTVAKGILHFDTAQLASIQHIANQCPLEGGSAVFKARSLLAMVEDIAFDDEAICEQLDSRQAISGEPDVDHQLSFSLVPNPAKQQVTAILSGKLDTEKVITVFDSFGREVYRGMIPANSNSIVLDVSSFESGLYICRLVQSDRETYSQKLIILN